MSYDVKCTDRENGDVWNVGVDMPRSTAEHLLSEAQQGQNPDTFCEIVPHEVVIPTPPPNAQLPTGQFLDEVYCGSSGAEFQDPNSNKCYGYSTGQGSSPPPNINNLISLRGEPLPWQDISIPENIFQNQYVLEIYAPQLILKTIDNLGADLITRVAQSKGWGVVYIVNLGDHLEVYLAADGTDPITITILVIIGIIALVVGIFAVRYLVREVGTQRFIKEAELTEQQVLDALKDVVNDPNVPQDIRDQAAQKIIDITDPILDPPQIPAPPSNGNGGGFFDGLDIKTIGLIAIAIMALTRK